MTFIHYIKRRYSKHACVLLPLILCFFGAEAAPSTRDDLYRDGKAAFENGDYLVASKNLYAFRQLEAIDAQELAQVDAALRYADEQIATAIAVKLQLEKYGKSIQIVTSGKFDKTGTKPIIVPVHLPLSPDSPKPTLSPKPGHSPLSPAVLGTTPAFSPGAAVHPGVTNNASAISISTKELIELKASNQTMRENIANYISENRDLRNKLESIKRLMEDKGRN